MNKKIGRKKQKSCKKSEKSLKRSKRAWKVKNSEKKLKKVFSSDFLFCVPQRCDIIFGEKAIEKSSFLLEIRTLTMIYDLKPDES
jgi:hypothetical protein